MEELTPTFKTTPFSIDALLKAAEIEDEDFASIKAFLEWAKVNQKTIVRLNKESLKERVDEYKKHNPKFTLGFYDESLIEAAANWTERKGKRKKRYEEESEDILEKRKRIEQIKQEEPKFTVNGEIKDPTGFFFLEPKQSNEKLLAGIERGDYIMLQGHRGSGKTTRCLYAIENQLSKYTCLWITLQGGINTNTIEEFWKSFGKRFMFKAEAQKLEFSVSVKDSGTFMEFFKEQQQKGNHIVLFLDEFDLLLDKKALDSLQIRQNSLDNNNLVNASETTPLDSLLNTLRGMKSDRFSAENQPALYGLQSCVIIGPLSILQAANTRLSPFNVSESLESPYFSEDDVKLLFQQFQDKTGKRLEDGITEDIFFRTRGHPGLTCYCGKRIHEDLAYGKSSLSLSEWKEFAVFKLPKAVPYAWPTVGRLQNVVEQPSNIDFLINYFLHTDKPVELKTKETIATAIYLTAEGALARISDTTFTIPSPLIRALILHVVSSKRKIKIPESLPIQEGSLNVAAVIQYGLPCFDVGVMQRALTQSYKKNETSGADVGTGKPVPEECCYQTELTFLLRQWLPDLWGVDTEVNAGSNHCDVVVTSPSNHRFALELVAHERDGPETRFGSVQGHFQRCKTEYKNILKADEAWVINFTTRKPAKKKDSGYVWPSANDGIRAIHIWHDLKWTQALIVLDSDKNAPIRIKLQ